MSYGSNHCCLNYSDEFHDLNNRLGSFDVGPLNDGSGYISNVWVQVSGTWSAASGILTGTGSQAFLRSNRTAHVSSLITSNTNGIINNGFGSGLFTTCFEENPQKWQEKIGFKVLPFNSYISFQGKASGLYEYPYDSVMEPFYVGRGAEIIVKSGIGGLVWGTGQDFFENPGTKEDNDLTKRGASLLILNNNKLQFYLAAGPDNSFPAFYPCMSGIPFFKVREVTIPPSGNNRISLRTSYGNGNFGARGFGCYYDDELLMTIEPNAMVGGFNQNSGAFDGWGIYASGTTKFSSYKQFYTIPDYIPRVFAWPSGQPGFYFPENDILAPTVASGQVDQIINTQASGSFINNFSASGNPTDLIFPNLRACKSHRGIFWPDTDFFPETCVITMTMNTNDPYLSSCGTKTSSLSYRSDPENTGDLDGVTTPTSIPPIQLIGATYGEETQNFTVKVAPGTTVPGVDLREFNPPNCFGVSINIIFNESLVNSCGQLSLPSGWTLGSATGYGKLFPDFSQLVIYGNGIFGFGYSVIYSNESNLLGPFIASQTFAYSYLDTSSVPHNFTTTYSINVQFM